MAEGSNVSITISGDAKQFKKSVDEARKLLGALDSKVTESGGIGKQAFASFIGNFSSQALTKAFSMAVDGVKLLISASGEWIAASAEQEAAQAKLNFALANTGRFTATSAQSFSEYADALSKNSMVGDDVILKNAALIQSYTNLSEEGLKRATQASLDWSTVTGQSMETTSALIAKASEGNIESLRRYGIFVESTGDKAKDFEAVLAAIEKKAGGAAADSINTFAGAQFQLANAAGEVGESLGNIITQNPVFVSAMKGGTLALQDFQKFLTENQGAIMGLVNEGFRLLVDTIPFVVDGAIAMAQSFTFARDSLNSLLGTDLESKLQNLQTQLEAVRKANEGVVNIETGAQVKTISEMALEEQIKRVEGEIHAADTITNTRQKMYDGLSASAAAFRDAQNLAIDEANASDVAKEMAIKDQKLLAQSEQAALDEENRLAKEQQTIANYAKDLEYFKGKLTAEEIEQIASDNRKLLAQGKFQEAERKMAAARDKAKRNDIFAIRKFEEMTDKEKLAAMQQSFQQIATLTQSSNDTLFGIGKAFAIADATIRGAQAVQLALSSAPPPFNFVLAALVGAAALTNVQKIANTKKPTGALDGALVTGGTYGKDTEPFMLSKGEVVAPARSFDEVVEGTARQRGFVKGDEQTQGNGQSINITINGDFLADDSYIDRLADRLADAVQHRNGPLAVRA